MKITSLIFDGSGVITDERPRITTERWSKKYNIPFDPIWQTVYLDNYFLARDGKLTAHEYYQNSIDKLHMNISYSDFIKDYIADCSIRPEMIAILRDLSKIMPLYLFSNQTEINTNYLTPLLKHYFVYALYSNKAHMHKPDKKIYRLLISNMKSDPTESLYIDDNKAPLMVAKEFGIQTYHFTSVEQFKKDIASLRLNS